MYIAFHVDDDRDKSVPIAVGKTRGEAIGLAAQRVLSKGITFGSIGVQENNELTQEQITKLKQTLDNYFKESES